MQTQIGKVEQMSPYHSATLLSVALQRTTSLGNNNSDKTFGINFSVVGILETNTLNYPLNYAIATILTLMVLLILAAG